MLLTRYWSTSHVPTGGTLISFFGVLGRESCRAGANHSRGNRWTRTHLRSACTVALPTFIYFKRQNDAKAREMYAQTRIKSGAMSQMSSGQPCLHCSGSGRMYEIPALTQWTSTGWTGEKI